MRIWQTIFLGLAVIAGGTVMAAETIHEFKMKSLDGKDVDLAQYKGKVLLVVNVASKCGATPQYEQLQSLQEKYGEKGLVVLGFPCNQFGAQEPGTPKEISEFCTSKYKVTFPMFSRIDVNGDGQAPLYSFLKKNAKTTSDIKWNFEKFVIGKDGKVVGRFETKVKPDAPEVVETVESALGK